MNDQPHGQPHGHAHQHHGNATPAGEHHAHHHGPARHDAAFAIGAGVNLAFVAAEAGFGVYANSVALIADAAHNLGDVLGLLLAWGAAWLTSRPPTARRTYGWGRGAILSAFANAAILLISAGAITVEAIRHLLDAAPAAPGIVIAVALAGVAVNGGTALLFLRGRHEDLNIRAQFTHLASDALISLAVAAGALAMIHTGLAWLDPVISLGIVAAIVAGTLGLFRESVGLVMDAVPERVKRHDVQAWLQDLSNVTEVHDLHIWGLSTSEIALTAHLVRAADTPALEPLLIADDLRHHFAIGHVTLQVESEAEAAECRLRPHHVV